VVEDYAGLDAGDAAVGINFEDASHVLGKIEDHGYVAALSGERGTTTAAEYRSAEFAAGGDCCEDVIGVAGDDDADGDLAVVGGVGCVEGPAAGVEADFPSDAGAESCGKCVGGGSCFVGHGPCGFAEE
jgi:hypothetical protein